MILRCTKCGAEVDAGCDCGAAYEALATIREQQRQASRAYRERKAEVKEQLRQLAPTEARMAGAILRELRTERGEKAEENQSPHHMTPKEQAVIDVDKRSIQYARHIVDCILRGIQSDQHNRELVLTQVIKLLTDEVER
jgi:hypothetical protein